MAAQKSIEAADELSGIYDFRREMNYHIDSAIDGKWMNKLHHFLKQSGRQASLIDS